MFDALGETEGDIESLGEELALSEVEVVNTLEGSKERDGENETVLKEDKLRDGDRDVENDRRVVTVGTLEIEERGVLEKREGDESLDFEGSVVNETEAESREGRGDAKGDLEKLMLAVEDRERLDAGDEDCKGRVEMDVDGLLLDVRVRDDAREAVAGKEGLDSAVREIDTDTLLRGVRDNVDGNEPEG